MVHGDVVLPARERVAGMAVRLPPRPGLLAGREGLLAELDGRLAPAAGRAGPRVGVLCGLGGAGKTSVAVEYAYRHLPEVGACWLLQAEDPAVLAEEFAVLAAQLGAREARDARDPVAAVHAVLARAQGGWLLVFDNVPDQAGIERFLPPAGDGRVVVTTQSQHWPAGKALDVPVLDLEVAAAFLVSRTGNGGDLGAARELAGELGGLPLALEQAAAYMQATGMPLGRYLPLFRARQADLLARGEAAGHRQHTAATLALALARLGRDAPAAVGACGYWRSWRPSRRRWACCWPAPARGNRCRQVRTRPSGRCSATRWRPGTRWRRCAATPWPPWPVTATSRSTGWSRPSPAPSSPQARQPSGSRPPQPWSRQRSRPMPP